jgi:flagellar biosynthesis chaperone FliJ
MDPFFEGLSDQEAEHRYQIEEHFYLDLINIREQLLNEEHRLSQLEEIQERSMADLRDMDEDGQCQQVLALYYSFWSTLGERIEYQKTRLEDIRKEYEDRRQEILSAQLKRLKMATGSREDKAPAPRIPIDISMRKTPKRFTYGPS